MEQPPSYAAATGGRDQISEQEQALGPALQRLKEDSSSPFGDADVYSIDRLRNFLCYALVVDYKAASQDNTLVELSAADATHYKEVYVCIARYVRALDETSADDEAKAILGAYFWEHVHAPARALGIPSDVAMSCIRSFTVYQTCYGTYMGCVAGLMHAHGVEALASKLIVDRGILIPRVAPHPEIEQVLLSSVESCQRRWFQRFAGFDYECGVYPEYGWCHAKYNAYELSDEGKRFQERQMRCEEFRKRIPETFDGVDKSAWMTGGQPAKATEPEQQGQREGSRRHRGLRFVVKKCLEAMERRASNNRSNRLRGKPTSYLEPPKKPKHFEGMPFFDQISCTNPNFFVDHSQRGRDRI